MSHMKNHENLLIDFNNPNENDQLSTNNQTGQSSIGSKPLDESDGTKKSPSKPLTFLSSQPLYQLLSSETNDVHDNNPFDHLDKQTYLLDDPFEIVENAALQPVNGNSQVETGTLIFLDSPVLNVTNETKSNQQRKSMCDTPKRANDTRNTLLQVTPSEDTSQNTSQNTSQKLHSNLKIVSPKTLESPTRKNRCKTKSTSLNLLKYSLSNSRTDLTIDSGSVGEENFSGDEDHQKKQKVKTPVRRESGSADSFDDIWSTKPNLIDSQNDIDVDSDIDNDIARLNIPMLNISKMEEHSTPKDNENEIDEVSTETKLHNRNELLEKYASIKQKIPASPAPADEATMIIHTQSVDTNHGKSYMHAEDEPVTPKSQYSSVLSQKSAPMENSNSLIENLKKLVNQYGDKSKKTTRTNSEKYLLDDLSSILATNDDKALQKLVEKRAPQPIKRQGTFSIEKDETDENKTQKEDRPIESMQVDTEAETNVIDPGLSQMVKQIQNVLGAHQSINVLQTNALPAEASAPAANPTYIVVMAQPATDFGEQEIQYPHRSRSQSLTMKDKPLAVNRAIQQKDEQSRVQSVGCSLASTPVKRPMLQRRSSFGAIIRTAPNKQIEQPNKPANNVINKVDASKVVRRRSFQGPLAPSLASSTEREPIHAKPLNPVTRRRSFQAPPTTSTCPPSPKSNLNRGPTAPLRMNSNTTGTLTRRKSFASDPVKDTPQKMKTSYGIMKKPQAPPTAKNFKIRVSQTVAGRSTAPLRAVVPMGRVASLLLANETVSPVDDGKSGALITSTPRSISSTSPFKSKHGPLSTISKLPVESPIKNLNRDSSYLSTTQTKSNIPAADSKVTVRRRTLSDYRTEPNNTILPESNNSGNAVSSIKNATKSITSGLSKFTAKRMSSIGLKRPSSIGSKENKQL